MHHTRYAAILAACLSLACSSKVLADEAATTVFYRLGPMAVHGNGADLFQISGGVFGFTDSKDTAAAVNLEYRFGRKLFLIGPAYGLMANTDGGLYGYAAAYLDLSWNDIFVTPLVAIGGWREGNSRDLGGVFQFRTSVDLAVRLIDGSRIGLRVAHISNANVHKSNPGDEELYLTYAIPLGPFL